MSSTPVFPVDKFFTGSDLTPDAARKAVQDGLKGADYGELFQEYTAEESMSKSKREYTSVSGGNSKQGFGFRVGQGDSVGYAYGDILTVATMQEAVAIGRQVLQGNGGGTKGLGGYGALATPLYTPLDPVSGMDLAEKKAAIDALESDIYALDPRITNVSISYGAEFRARHIITPDGVSLSDVRPSVGLRLGVQMTDAAGNSEGGGASLSGRMSARDLFNDKAACMAAAKKAVQQAEILLSAADAPPGVMDAVLGPEWNAVLLHEAVGHPLEGDFNRKAMSVYSGKIGDKVAADCVTIVDQGDTPGLRGSIHFDDEGTPTRRNVLVENGVLKGYMQDRQNAQLMGQPLTGNGRRQTYAHLPMPRMTNTFFEAGARDPQEIIASVKDGIYVKDMAGGAVDITSGDFNMNVTLAYRIRDGKLAEPLKGATLVGNGPEVIKSITMMGNDLAHEKNTGSCGKEGQWVPVGVGQPTLRIAGMTVGGKGKR